MAEVADLDIENEVRASVFKSMERGKHIQCYSIPLHTRYTIEYGVLYAHVCEP